MRSGCRVLPKYCGLSLNINYQYLLIFVCWKHHRNHSTRYEIVSEQQKFLGLFLSITLVIYNNRNANQLKNGARSLPYPHFYRLRSLYHPIGTLYCILSCILPVGSWPSYASTSSSSSSTPSKPTEYFTTHPRSLTSTFQVPMSMRYSSSN
jgi:hypothetical protein